MVLAVDNGSIGIELLEYINARFFLPPQVGNDIVVLHRDTSTVIKTLTAVNHHPTRTKAYIQDADATQCTSYLSYRGA